MIKCGGLKPGKNFPPPPRGWWPPPTHLPPTLTFFPFFYFFFFSFLYLFQKKPNRPRAPPQVWTQFFFVFFSNWVFVFGFLNFTKPPHVTESTNKHNQTAFFNAFFFFFFFVVLGRQRPLVPPPVPLWLVCFVFFFYLFIPKFQFIFLSLFQERGGHGVCCLGPTLRVPLKKTK